MSKLLRRSSPAVDRLEGYLAAAQLAFIKGQCDVTLEASFFDILDRQVSNEDVIVAAYGDCFNPIELQRDCSLEEMIDSVNETLTLPRKTWHPDWQGIPNIMEKNLREGYWQHLKACFNYEKARIVELGHDVPWVNILVGFTYVLYKSDMSECALLVGNTTD